SGHVNVLLGHFTSKTWQGVWQELNLALETFESVGLSPRALDREIWQLCQERELILLTRNRNDDGPESLGAAIRTLNQLDSLPVITLANADRILENKSYAERVAERLLDYLLYMDNLLGTGRLYVP